MVALRSVMLSAMLAPRVVVFGPGSLDMRLLTAKLAARAGLDTALFVGGGSKVKVPAWQCPGSAPAPPQGAPSGSRRLETPRARGRPSGEIHQNT